MKVCSKCGSPFGEFGVCPNCGSTEFREIGGAQQNNGADGAQSAPVNSAPQQNIPPQSAPVNNAPQQNNGADSAPQQNVPPQGVPVEGVPVNNAEPQGVPVQGVPINNAEPQGVPVQGVPLGGATAKQSPAEWFKDPKHKKIIIGAGAGLVALIVIIVVIILVASAKPTIDIADGLADEVVVSGGDGYGTVEIYDEEFWESIVYGYIENEYGETSSTTLEIESYIFLGEITVEWHIDPEEDNGNYSNGDTVTVWAEIDMGTYDFPFKLECSEYKVEISGLPEVETVDLFEDVEVEYLGNAPYATVYVDDASVRVGDTYIYVEYSYDLGEESTGLSNGDTFTVTAEFDAEELLNLGYCAESTTKEYTVSGLSTYVTATDEITDDALEDMKSEAKALIKDNWSADSEELESTEYLGYYILNNDTKGQYHDQMIVLVYNVKGSCDNESNVSYYTGVAFDDVLVLDDGTNSYDEASFAGYEEVTYGDGIFNRNYYNGCETLEELKDDLYLENYTCVISGDDLQ